MKIKKYKGKIFYLLAVGVSIFFLFFFIAVTWIGYDVKTLCLDAKREYEKADCTDALISLLEDENRGFRARNNAIWALGQLGDTHALPILERYYTGNIADREPLDEMISQYELKKAIKLAEGGINITSIFWRGAIN